MKTVDFKLLPLEPGDYELRFVQNSRRVLARRAITVTEALATLTAPDTAPIGATLDIPFTGPEPASTFLTDRHRHAVDQLNSAFNTCRPVAVMIGEGYSTSNFVVQSFAAGLASDVAFARIEEPCSNATEFMGQVIDALGFEPKDMCLEDLEGIFKMFLSFQKSHSHRTVLCVERTQEQDLWVLDKLCIQI